MHVFYLKCNSVAIVRRSMDVKTARKTAAKTKIHELLAASKTALAHSDIQHMVGGLCDRVTIYRVLDRLAEAGAIHKIVDMDGTVKYAACRMCSAGHHHNHVHFSCQKCHALLCLENVVPSYTLPETYTVLETNFTLSGLCPQCA